MEFDAEIVLKDVTIGAGFKGWTNAIPLDLVGNSAGIPPEFRRISNSGPFFAGISSVFFRFPIGLCVPAIFSAFRYTFPP